MNEKLDYKFGKYDLNFLIKLKAHDFRKQNIDNISEKQIRDYLLESPLTTQHNISISGGNETMTNSVSLLFEDNKGFFQGDDSKKYLINFLSQFLFTIVLKWKQSGLIIKLKKE